MLVLGRRVGQRIMLGEDFVFTVLSIQKGHVELGINKSDASSMRVVRQALNQNMRISEHIVICVLGLQVGIVCLGIQAPRSIVIGREEVFSGKTKVDLSGFKRLVA